MSFSFYPEGTLICPHHRILNFSFYQHPLPPYPPLSPPRFPCTASQLKFEWVHHRVISDYNNSCREYGKRICYTACESAFAGGYAAQMWVWMMPVDYHVAVMRSVLVIQKTVEVVRRKKEWELKMTEWERVLVEGGYRERTRRARNRWVEMVGWREAERLCLAVEWGVGREGEVEFGAA